MKLDFNPLVNFYDEKCMYKIGTTGNKLLGKVIKRCWLYTFIMGAVTSTSHISGLCTKVTCLSEIKIGASDW